MKLWGDIAVNEDGLEGFRSILTPDEILKLLPEHPHIHAKVPIGVGKTWMANQLMAAPATYEKYDGVLYLAPIHDILKERIQDFRSSPPPVPYLLLAGRPRKKCGDLDAEWEQHERNGRSELAKATLCPRCPRFQRCDWRTRLSDRVGNKRLLLATEQHLVAVHDYLRHIKRATGKENWLVVIDECKMSHASFCVSISPSALEAFLTVLETYAQELPDPPAWSMKWQGSIRSLLQTSARDFSETSLDFPDGINAHAARLQLAGVNRFGGRFSYLGHVLPKLRYSRGHERWMDGDRACHFVVRPRLTGDVLFLAANLPSGYIRFRLGLSSLASPFETVKVRHTRTKFYNIVNSAGADRHFLKNHRRVLDFFVAKIVDNIKLGKTTLLICRKKYKKLCATYIARRCEELSIHVKVELGAPKRGHAPSPEVIPMIHYGAIGINAFENYEVCLCLNSFYISHHVLEAAVQDSRPPTSRISINIYKSSHGYRKPEVDPSYRFTDVPELARQHLVALEVDPVLQAIGRCRPFTKPREVVLFQMNDLSPHLGAITELRSLEEAYSAFGLRRPRLSLRQRHVEALLERLALGDSLRHAADIVGISRSTASRWLKAERSKAKVSQEAYKDFTRQIGTPPDERFDDGSAL